MGWRVLESGVPEQGSWNRQQVGVAGDLGGLKIHGVRAPHLQSVSVSPPKRLTPEPFTTERLAPKRFAQERFTPERFTPGRFTPERFTPESITPELLTLERFTPRALWPLICPLRSLFQAYYENDNFGFVSPPELWTQFRSSRYTG